MGWRAGGRAGGAACGLSSPQAPCAAGRRPLLHAWEHFSNLPPPARPHTARTSTWPSARREARRAQAAGRPVIDHGQEPLRPVHADADGVKGGPGAGGAWGCREVPGAGGGGGLVVRGGPAGRSCARRSGRRGGAARSPASAPRGRWPWLAPSLA